MSIRPEERVRCRRNWPALSLHIRTEHAALAVAGMAPLFGIEGPTGNGGAV